MIQKIKNPIVKIVSFILVTVFCMVSFCSCGIPKVEDIRGRVEELVEGAREINEVLWGKGLECLPYSDVYGDDWQNYVYGGFENYSPVTKDCGYLTIFQIKDEAEKYYSQNFLNKSVYEMMFTGYADPSTDNVITPRYLEHDEDGWLTVSNTWEPFFEKQSLYNYDTIKIISPSNSRFVTISIWAYGTHVDVETKTSVEGWYETKLSLSLQDGQWYLESPSY